MGRGVERAGVCNHARRELPILGLQRRVQECADRRSQWVVPIDGIYCLPGGLQKVGRKITVLMSSRGSRYFCGVLEDTVDTSVEQPEHDEPCDSRPPLGAVLVALKVGERGKEWLVREPWRRIEVEHRVRRERG